MLENNKGTIKLLEDKLADIGQLVKQLNQPTDSSTPGRGTRSTSDGESPYLDSRLMRSSYVPGEGLEPIMPSIEEEAQSRRTSLASERRRSSYKYVFSFHRTYVARTNLNFSPSFADIELLPQPTPEIDEPGSDDEPAPPMFNVEPRSRRRRDSHFVRQPDAVPEPVPSPAKSTPIPSSKPPKRKLSERDPDPPATSTEPEDHDFRFTKLSERVASKREQRNSEETRSRGFRFIREDVDTATPEAETNEKEPKAPILLKGLDRRLSSSGAIPPLAARQALGPSKSSHS
jgi:hypothetical protein